MKFIFPDRFDPQPTLENETLCLRPLTRGDLKLLGEAASDPAIWKGHPVQNRYRSDVFSSYYESLIEIGGCLLVLDQKTGEVIGCSAYYTDPSAQTRLSIGFTFLTCKYWGGSTNRSLKRLMLGHLFHNASEAWFHIAPQNLRSQAATKKLGAVLTHESKIDLGGGPQPWYCYCLTSECWKATSETVQPKADI